MSRICAALCACMLGLAGCVHTSKAEFTRHYALGRSTPVAAADRHGAGQGILQISSISVPPWLAGTDMLYRLDYRHDSRLSAYGKSDWIAPPARLLEPIIQNTIAAAGDWRAVLGPRDPAKADATLHIRLGDFSQAFAQPHHSTGVIDATATLIDNHDDDVIAQKHFHVEVAAPAPNASGGTKALGKASQLLAAQLQRWLHDGVRQHPLPQSDARGLRPPLPRNDEAVRGRGRQGLH